MTDRYEIIKLLSKDPAGGVYLAEDTTLGRKVVFRHIDADHAEDRTDSWAKDFATYAGKLCALQHPNLLTIYDVAVDDDGVSMVGQNIEGESLAERLELGPLRQVGVYRLAADGLEALHAAHTSGVFHGALHTGSIKRLARATGGHRYLIVDLGLNTLATMVKGVDVQIADPVLMAPELHLDGAEPDAKSDLFMLGQLCYTALAGGHPFAGKLLEDCARAHQAGELPPLSKYVPEAQPDFEAWVMRLCSGDRDDRPASVKVAMEELQAITIDEPEPNVPGRTHAVTAVLEQANTTAQASGLVTVTSDDPTAPGPGHDYAMADKQSNKKWIIITASLCGLIVLALVLSLTRSGDKPDTQDPVAQAAVSDKAKVHLHNVELVNTIAQRTEPVVVDLETENAIDWTVATGVPASSNRREKEKGNFIQSIFATGEFREFPMKNVPVKFKAGGAEIIPAAATDSRGGNGAKEKEGWDIMLRVPKKYQGGVMVSFFMTQWQCDFAIEVTLPDGKEVIRFLIPKQEPGVVKIPIEIAKPKPGGFYSFSITAASPDPKGSFSMGINGVLVESN